MQVSFAAERPADTDVIGFVIQKSQWESFAFPLENADAVRETAKLARFEGNAGQSFLYFAQEGGRTIRIALIAVADGDGQNKALVSEPAHIMYPASFAIGIALCRASV